MQCILPNCEIIPIINGCMPTSGQHTRTFLVYNICCRKYLNIYLHCRYTHTYAHAVATRVAVSCMPPYRRKLC